jgi:hypothetical protein
VQDCLDEFVDDGFSRRGPGAEISRAQCGHARNHGNRRVGRQVGVAGAHATDTHALRADLAEHGERSSDVGDAGLGELFVAECLGCHEWISFPGAIAGEWAGQLRLIGDAFGVEVDEVREDFDRAVTNETLEVAMGTVEAGTCGAIRMKAIGVVDGREAIIVEHVTRLARSVAPDWPTGIGDLSYRVVITGAPDIDCTLAATLRDPGRAGIGSMTSGAGAMVATAMRVVNAVPYVVAAAPGLLSAVDLPLTIPKNVFVTQQV